MNIFSNSKSIKKVLKSVVALSMFLFLSNNVFAQPQNDDPCGAIFLNLSNVCTMQVFANDGATGSPGVADPACSNYENDDIWFQVLVPPGGSLIIKTEEGQITDASMAVYTGDCNNLVEIACDDDSGDGLMPELFVSGLTQNSIVFIRVWTWGGLDVGTFGICAMIPPPPPSNDECAGAINIPVNVDLNCGNTVSGTTMSATLSSSVPAPTCGSAGINDDVWFSFVATGANHHVSLLNVTGFTDMALAVYSGTCGAVTQLICSDPNSLSLGGLTPGDTYFVRVWTWSSSAGISASFDICVGTPPPPPANDECSGAISLPVNPDMTCTNVVAGSTTSALTSTSAPAPSCGAAGINDDVWFSFVATSAQHNVTLSNVTGSVTDMAMALYSGACGTLSEIMCSDPNSMTTGGLTPGNTYYVRVWTWSSTVGSSANFDICVGTPPPPPANDECSGAINVPVNPDTNCGVVVRGSTQSTTQSTGVPLPACANAGLNDDVWFSFVATATQHLVSLTNFGAGTSDMVMAMYQGTSCGALTPMNCSDPETMIVGGLNIGETYYIRVWTWSSTSSTFGEFDICIGTLPPPQQFDEPCGALLLTVNENGECNFETFSNISASGSNGVPAPGCAGYQGGDVWFKLVVPCTGTVNINTTTGTVTDGGMAIYTGTCDNLTLLECDDDDSPNGFMPMINAVGLTPGDTLYIRFWEYGNDNQGTFGICASIPAAAPPAASCQTAMPFCTSSTPTTVPNITNQPSLGGSGVYGCLLTIPNPTYYYLQIQNTGDITIEISQTSTTGNGLDVDFIVWGPFTSLDGACTGLSAANIIDCSYLTNSVEYADIANAQAGEFYLFLVTNYSNQPGTITYQQTGGGGISNCAINCIVEPTNSGPVCIGGTLNLNANTIPSATYAWSGPNCFTSTEQNPTSVPIPTTPGVYTYTVIATGLDGARCSDTTRVTVLAAPQLGVDSTVTICANSTLELQNIYASTTGLATTWYYNDQPITNTNISTPGIYEVIATNDGGCSDTAVVTVIINDLSISSGYAQTGCAQAAVITAIAQGGVPPYTFTISTDVSASNSDGIFNVTTPGQHIITVTDNSGCTASYTTDVVLLPPLTVNAGVDVEIFSAETVQLNAQTNQNINSVLWTPSTGLSSTTIINPTASPEVTTTYTVEVSTIDGCTATDDVTITVVPLCINLRNAFTPNGDGINDMFMVYNSRGCLSKVRLQVFNRYGNKVFESKDYFNDWDGTYKGKHLPDGTYYAVVDYTMSNGRVITRKTDVTILR